MKIIIELTPSNGNSAKIFDVLGDESDTIEVTFDGLNYDEDFTLRSALLINGKEVSSTDHSIAESNEKEGPKIMVIDKKNL